MADGGGRNPVLPAGIEIPDPEAHVTGDGRLFVYGSLDGPGDTYCSGAYRPVSTRDLRTWTVHPPSFRAEQVPWFGEAIAEDQPYTQKRTPFMIESGRSMSALDVVRVMWSLATPSRRERFLYAPDAIEHGGRHYLYFCMADGSEGVAVSDRPEGPFTDPVRLPVTGIDPAVFVDDDGAAYYYWGQWSAHGVKLDADMASFDAREIRRALVTEQEHGFHEGSSMRRIGDLYYLVYADMHRGRPTALGYATAPTPLGPFTYRGVIVDNVASDPAAWNNHGSIEEIGGRHYVFYHRPSRGTRFHRRLCVEPIEVRADGTIPEVPMTSQGAGEPFAPGESIEARRACALSGHVRIDLDPSGAEVLTQVREGDAVTFRYLARGGYAGLTLSVAGTAEIEVAVDGVAVGVAGADGPGILRCRAPFTVSGPGELALRIRSPRGLSVFGVTLA